MNRVIYRVDKRDPSESIAFLPDVEANRGMIVCYAHVGQHSEGSIDYYRSNTKAPKPGQALALHKELTRIYGKLDIRKRMVI